MTARRAEIEAVFDEALDQPTGERAEWVSARCGDDVELRREVELLLAAHAETNGPLDIPAVAHIAELLKDTVRGRRIGPYRVLSELGRGGMGVVYLADRDDGQFRHRVAIKVLRSTDACEAFDRFRAERQILASLSHPHIAKLLDGGVSDDQLPYLVIEYIDGHVITEYCDRNKLGIEARLKLFRDVCSAVHYAHQNLVLHRDLKPGNVLVDGAAQVKLLDFGIAKLLNPNLAGIEQPVTQTAFRLMTPAYASPEQVRGDSLTTASDLYALGLLLYELLAGRPAHRLTTGSPQEVYQVVCERDPERPSDIVIRESEDSKAATPAELAAARNTTPDRLHKQLRGDLDAIVAMALRKEPIRRYGSAELLATDVGRYLDGLPVVAHRGSGWYRFEKFVRRHRAVATVAVAGAVLLVGAAAVALRLATVATRERDRSAVALTQTQRALGESEAVTDFLVGLFEASDPLEGSQGALSADDLLRRGVSRAERLSPQPAAQARMLEALGRVYASRGELDAGAKLLERALHVRRSSVAPNETTTAATATTIAVLADVRRRQGNYALADSLANEALRVRRATLGDSHPDVAASLTQLAGLAIYRGNVPAAEAYQVEAVDITRRVGADSTMVDLLERLSAIVWRRGDDVGAERALREAVAISQRAFPVSHQSRTGATMRLAVLLSRNPERRVEAESLGFATVEESRAGFGDEHVVTAATMKQLGDMLVSHGRNEAGQRLIRQALAIEQRVFGPAHEVTATTTLQLAVALKQSGYSEEGERLARDASTSLAKSLGTKHSMYAGALGYIADYSALRGALDSAEVLYRRAVAIRAASLGPQQALTALTEAGLAGVLTKRGRFAEADSLYRNTLSVLRRQTTDTHLDVRLTYAGLAALYEAWGKPDSAAVYRRLAEPTSSNTR